MRRVAQLDGELEIPARKDRVAQIELPTEPVQRLELLQTVTLDADAKGLAHDGMEIDEASAAQEPVDSSPRVAWRAHRRFRAEGSWRRSGRCEAPDAFLRRSITNR
jgi:hypothetical protein